ncbi:MAG: HAD hydrolase-like protein [Clostridia bacterium]|nr:HAD hydrolase-like protein [Clostridia bacterium]
MNQLTTVLWDFNGVIYNDVEISLRAINELLRRHGGKPLSGLDEYRRVFGFPIRDYYERVGLDFSRTPFEELAIEWVSTYRSLEPLCCLYPGVAETVAKIGRETGASQILLSATEQNMLREQTESLGIGHVFDEILGTGTIHATGKVELARQYKEKHERELIICVGDTVYDAEVATAIGAECILVSWGHQDEKRLKETGFTVVPDISSAGKLIIERLKQGV